MKRPIFTTMRLKKVKIGGVVTENNVFLAPLAGFSDFAMRKICEDMGAGLTFTEMVSCKGLLYDNANTKDILFTVGNGIKAAQIFGNDPDVMLEAATGEELGKFDVIDVNFGCPMPKIYNNGEGSALLKDPALAEKIIRTLKKCGKPITAKMRTGLTLGDGLGLPFAKALEQGGADMITVHGRPKDRIYAGEPDYDGIEMIKNAVSVPVIANGGVFDADSADLLIERTGADGVMIARGALENPFIFADITGKKRIAESKKELIFKHVDLLKTRYDDRTVAITFRKQLCLYLKGEKNASALKQKILTLKDTDSIKREIDAALP